MASTNQLRPALFAHALWVVGLAVTGVCYGQVDNELDACGAIANRDGRLECYDKLRVSRHAAANSSALDKQPEKQNDQHVASAVVVQPVTKPVPAPVSAVVATPLPSTPESKSELKSAAKKPAAEIVIGQVKSARRNGNGLLTVELDDNQLFRELMRSSLPIPNVGEKVKIKPGALGSYFLINESGLSVRVDRLR